VQTARYARVRLRKIAYAVGCNGKRVDMRYTVVAWSAPLPRVTERAGFYGVVSVPWKHPAYWYPDGTPVPDEL
jgi:hypothetical protein